MHHIRKSTATATITANDSFVGVLKFHPHIAQPHPIMSPILFNQSWPIAALQVARSCLLMLACHRRCRHCCANSGCQTALTQISTVFSMSRRLRRLSLASLCMPAPLRSTVSTPNIVHMYVIAATPPLSGITSKAKESFCGAGNPA